MTRRWAELCPGLVGGLGAVAVSLVLRPILATRLLAELVIDAGSQILGPRLFDRLLERLGHDAKPLLFGSVIVAEVALYAIAWLIAGSLAPASRPRKRVLLAAGLATSCLIVLSATLVMSTEASLGGTTAWADYLASILVSSTAYGLIISVSSTPALEAGSSSRRRFLTAAFDLGVVGAAVLLLGRSVYRSSGGGARASRKGQPTPEITPNDEFYIVSKNLIDPVIAAGSWRLRVGGSTATMLELSYADVLAQPAIEAYATLQCISNPVGGNLMSNALWKGFRLRDLIERAQPSPDAAFVLFRSEDDFLESLPLDFASQDSVLLVYEMNGERLPDKHGFPLRLLAPGKYGFKHPKWLTEIALVDEDTLGYWEKRYWSPEARMNTSCRIDVPAPGDHFTAATVRIHGVAFSGDRGISGVEVSTDGGAKWSQATLKPALSAYTWVLWYFDWTTLGQSGHVEIVARARDGTGEVQTAVEAFPHPNGATGYPRVTVTVTQF